ncbi:uncharacterized protein LOC110675486 [Aedes aegypti]|uniref:Uncharacterized protein n=1 Tax=Aedes aegypti TaxID=7159 RepID=A0A6I8U413_AEDAE|nr:uncharacterized protein LOC110675486 [Aedes aegypti]
MLGFVKVASFQLSRRVCTNSQVYVLQNLYASKPSIRNQIKTDNFKSYEDLGKVKKFVFRELQQDETGLGPIPTVEEEAKFGEYKNPEYYSYHNYSYYDFELGIQCMHLPQPCAIDENDLLTMVRKACIGEVEDHSGRCCPPPKCTVECMKESSSNDLDEKERKPKSNGEEGKCIQSIDSSTSQEKCSIVEKDDKELHKDNKSVTDSGPKCGNQDPEKQQSNKCGNHDTEKHKSNKCGNQDTEKQKSNKCGKDKE